MMAGKRRFGRVRELRSPADKRGIRAGMASTGQCKPSRGRLALKNSWSRQQRGATWTVGPLWVSPGGWARALRDRARRRPTCRW